MAGFLADENVPTEAVDEARRAGFDLESNREFMPATDSEVPRHFVPQNAAGNRLCFCGDLEADSGSDRPWYPMRNLWPAYGLAT